MDRDHHALENGIEELAGVFGVAVGQQVHQAFEIGKQHRDLLAFACKGTTGGEDLLGKVGRGETAWSLGTRTDRCWEWGERMPTDAQPGRPHTDRRRQNRRDSRSHIVGSRDQAWPYTGHKTSCRRGSQSHSLDSAWAVVLDVRQDDRFMPSGRSLPRAPQRRAGAMSCQYSSWNTVSREMTK
jgi:hypothetical protein